MKDVRIFLLGREKTLGFFEVLYFSPAQISNNISAIYCLCGIFVIKFVDAKNRDILGFAKKKQGFLEVDKF